MEKGDTMRDEMKAFYTARAEELRTMADRSRAAAAEHPERASQFLAEARRYETQRAEVLSKLEA